MSEPRAAPSAPSRSRFRWLRLALGPALLLVIMASIDRDALVRAFARAELAPLLWAYAAILPTVLLRAYRWGLLGAAEGAPALGQRLLAYAYALFVGVATPGRLGEFVKTAYLTRRGLSFGRAFSSVLLDRLFDVGFLLLLAAFGVSVLALPVESEFATRGIVAALAFGVALAVYVARPGPAARVGRLLASVAPARYRGWLDATLGDFFAAVRGLSFGALLASAMLTVAAWMLNYLSNYLFAVSLGLELDFAEVAGISAVCSLIALLPISVLGAGTRDAALILILARYGYGASQAVALSTLFLSLSLWTGIACAPALLSDAVRLGAEVPGDGSKS